MGAVADRIRPLLRYGRQFLGPRHELQGDRVGGVCRIDQLGHVRGDREGVAGEDGPQSFHPLGGDEARFRQLLGAAQRAAAHGAVSATGVHSTSSIRPAPQASMTRRSKPSAMPDASGMCARAARKSSSMG